MASDDEFLPRLGRQRSGGDGGRARSAVGALLAAATLARGGPPAASSRGGGACSRIGRGTGVGGVLGARDRFAAFRARRVIVKARIVKLAGKGLAAAKAHLRYVERDGTTREGNRGDLYGPGIDKADRAAFIERSQQDRHQFRFIVSPEDGGEYQDFKDLTRRLMMQVEKDLATRLDWVAIDHFDTGHPHIHVIVRGKDERGMDLVIARDYLQQGMRERAAELVDLDLGPRTDAAITRRLLAEIDAERLTSIDRSLLREADDNGLVIPGARRPFEQSLRLGRLRQLERLALASRDGGGWTLVPDMADRLRSLGERGDIIRTMQRAFAARGEDIPPQRLNRVYDPASAEARPLVGQLVTRGLASEIDDRHYLVIAGSDGLSHYVDIGKGEGHEPLRTGAILSIAPQIAAMRPADRTVVAVAQANEGVYSVGAHLLHDDNASQAFAEAHVRRLEAMRRALGKPERNGDGTWTIGSDHSETVIAYENLKARDHPVIVETLSPFPLAQLVEAEAATWLDEELARHGGPRPAVPSGFGRELAEALDGRQRWLASQGLASAAEGPAIYVPDLTARLRQRELAAVARQLSGELGLEFVAHRPGERIEGIVRRPVDLVSGRYALIERSREFTLVPWRPVLEREMGKVVSGLMRENGINWTIGRGRGGPTIS